jgi:hypothetical protein
MVDLKLMLVILVVVAVDFDFDLAQNSRRIQCLCLMIRDRRTERLNCSHCHEIQLWSMAKRKRNLIQVLAILAVSRQSFQSVVCIHIRQLASRAIRFLYRNQNRNQLIRHLFDYCC